MVFGKKKYTDSLSHEEIADAVRKATNKHLLRPDPALTQKAIGTINTGFSDVTGAQVASVLIKRLRDDNPHKQWLAILLSQQVMRNCNDVVTEAARSEILAEVASIAIRPVSTQQTNAGAAQKARQEAFTLLQEHGEEGKQAMQRIAGAGAVQLLVNDNSSPEWRSPTNVRPSGRHGPGETWTELKNLINTEVQVAKNQTEVLQDMLRNIQSGVGDFERSFFEELTAQMVNFRITFEGNVSRLASYGTDEAQLLMVSALETIEAMNTALNQYHEFITSGKMSGSGKAVPAAAAAPATGPLDSLIDLGDALEPASGVVPNGPAITAPSPVPTLAPTATSNADTFLDDLLSSIPAPAPAPSHAEAPLQQIPPPAQPSENPFGAPTFTYSPTKSGSVPHYAAQAQGRPIPQGQLPYPSPGVVPPQHAAMIGSGPKMGMGGATGTMQASPMSGTGFRPTPAWSPETAVDFLPSGLPVAQAQGPAMRSPNAMSAGHANQSYGSPAVVPVRGDAFDDLLTSRH